MFQSYEVLRETSLLLFWMLLHNGFLCGMARLIWFWANSLFYSGDAVCMFFYFFCMLVLGFISFTVAIWSPHVLLLYLSDGYP